MAQLEDRIERLIPDLPAEMVVQLFLLNGRVSDVLRVANLSGPELAKAKLHLPAIRKELIQGRPPNSSADNEALEDLLTDLEFARAVSILRKAVPEFSRHQHRLEASSDRLARLCERQARNAAAVRAVNSRIALAGSSSSLGAHSTDALLRQRSEAVTAMQGTFDLMQKAVEERLRILSDITEFSERMLHFAGCSKSEIHSAGGVVRDVRTTYKRLQRLTPVSPFRLDREAYVRTFKKTLRSMATAATEASTLRRSIKSDMEQLSRSADLKGTDSRGGESQPETGAWNSGYWQKVYGDILADRARRASESSDASST